MILFVCRQPQLVHMVDKTAQGKHSISVVNLKSLLFSTIYSKIMTLPIFWIWVGIQNVRVIVTLVTLAYRWVLDKAMLGLIPKGRHNNNSETTNDWYVFTECGEYSVTRAWKTDVFTAPNLTFDQEVRLPDLGIIKVDFLPFTKHNYCRGV